ncbi:hypothetical protein LOY67_23670 [Pseudomonas sp. B21-056]|jgi:hypothetical protein|uniref:hypothetical protein n=1 Tax=Pseudomonas sp. B21-056 TaxID=2895495 RepID=UPI00222FAC9D|nr:hypothetical protein [Pseudomonas sp. B21-056]UZE22974.1 hypothetical protein LOY67_23670 [Pseudomonas sp. B21-056]
MIPVAKPDEPDDFEKNVRTPGNQWLKDNPGAARPSPFWNKCATELADHYSNLCGYAAMLDPTGGTLDHYLSYKHHPELAYEWSNYRFASGTLNSIKKTADDTVLDPHEVGAGWFEIILPSLQMCTTDAIPAAYRAKAEYTLKRLNLRDGERIIRWRQSWYSMYKRKKLPLEGLREVAPLIADAVEKAGV